MDAENKKGRATDQLTQTQKQLIDELDKIYSLLSLDYKKIASEYSVDTRTAYLELAKDTVIRGQVIIWYTLLDEFLNNKLCHYYFGRKRSFLELWKTKRFQLFNYNILNELTLLKKLDHVNAIKEIPKNIRSTIKNLNDLRNGLAHSFFPENRRKSKPEWKGKNIFTLEGLEALQEDIAEVSNYFIGSQLPY